MTIMMIKPHDKKACKIPRPQNGFELKNITMQYDDGSSQERS
jgi:hypothetical protein